MSTKKAAIHKFTAPLFISFYILSFVMHGMAYSTTMEYGSSLPGSLDIEDSARKAVQTADVFMRESIEARLAYECSGRFLSQAQQIKLHNLAQTSVEQLGTIINSQRLLKKQIEDYEGNDWEELYGESGLWRRLKTYLERSILFECEINYLRALSATQNEKRLILHDTLEKLASLPDGCPNAECLLLKTKIFISLSPDNNDYQQLARKLLQLLLAEGGADEKIYIRAAVEKIKLSGQSKSDQLKELADRLAGSSCKDDFELNLSMAFLQRRFGSVKGLEKVSTKWPEARAFMGNIILQDLKPYNFEQLSVIEAQLAAQAAWQIRPAQYADLLTAMAARKELQTPLVLYVAAVSLAETSPALAIEMLIKASQLQQLKASDSFLVPAKQIAGEAAQLAYQLFTKESSYCETARRVIAGYITLTKDEPEQKIEYFYSVILSRCGRVDEGKKLLSKIANGKGSYRHKARYELIALTVREQKYNQLQNRADLIRQLDDLLAAVDETDEFSREVRNDAKLMYCQLLIAQADKPSAEKAISIIAELEKTTGQKLTRLNSLALQQSGRLKEALQALNSAIDSNDCTDALQGLELLLKIIEKIDEYALQNDNFENVIGHCCHLAEYCFRCVPSSAQQKATLVLAEFSIFKANGQNNKLSTADKLLNELAKNLDEQNVDLLRCRARLLMARKRYNEAAELWFRICQIRKAKEPWAVEPPKDALWRNWLWWRAKFYQLDCRSRTQGSSREDILHGLEVLETGLSRIPQPWAEKLGALKRTLQRENLKTQTVIHLP